MRRALLSHFLVATLLSSCAYEGVIVEKRFRPLPFPDSLGVDAIYNFQLRDSAGQIHSQMVTPDVFASYRVGDYFNDLQSPPSHEDKEVQGFRPAPREMNEGPYQPVRVMQMQRPVTPAAKIAVQIHHDAKHTSKTTNAHHRARLASKKLAVHGHHQAKHTSKTTKAHHRTKHVAKVAKKQHHTKKRAKVAGKHRRTHHRKTVASAN